MSDNIDDLIRRVRERWNGKTIYEGVPDWERRDAILAAEVVRLRKENDALSDTVICAGLDLNPSLTDSECVRLRERVAELEGIVDEAAALLIALSVAPRAERASLCRKAGSLIARIEGESDALASEGGRG